MAGIFNKEGKDMANKRQRMKMAKKAEAETVDYLANQTDSKLKYVMPTVDMYKEMSPKEKSYVDNLVRKMKSGTETERNRAFFNYVFNINSVNKKKLDLSFEFTQKVYNFKKLVDDRGELFEPTESRFKRNANYQKQIGALKKEQALLREAQSAGIKSYGQEISSLQKKINQVEDSYRNNARAEAFMEAFETLPKNEIKHYKVKNTGEEFAIETLDVSHEYIRDKYRNMEAYLKDDGYVVVADLDAKPSSGQGRGRFVWGGYYNTQDAVDTLNMYMRKAGPTEKWGTKKAEDIF